jgi:hypothetical protein
VNPAYLFGVKLATVPGPTKRYRRLLRQGVEGGFDYHGTGNMGAVAEAGGLEAGTRNTFGRGVYWTQDRPQMEYWTDTRANGPREGGVIMPRHETGSVPAALFAPGEGAYRTSSNVALNRNTTAVVKDTPALRATQEAMQRKYNVRPALMSEMHAADQARKGVISVEEGARLAHLPMPKTLSLPWLPSHLDRVAASGERAWFAAKNMATNLGRRLPILSKVAIDRTEDNPLVFTP